MSIVWAIDGDNITYDNKLVLIGDSLFWKHNNKFCRSLDIDDLISLKNFLIKHIFQDVVCKNCEFKGPVPDNFESWSDWVDYTIKNKKLENVCISKK